MIPTWKIKRELARLQVQVYGLFGYLTDPYRRRKHKVWRTNELKAYEGRISESAKIALLLIYQPKLIPESLLQSIKHLVQNGYSPLVISNTPLSSSDTKLLLENCWRLVFRPNFGYDFGGYQDGVWLLNQLGIQPTTLLIQNDSVWHPIFDGSTMLEQMEASPADFVGTQIFERISTKPLTPELMFMGSYCFMIKEKAYESEAFQSFWINYRATSNKEKTLRRGERAFSRKLMDAGITFKGIFAASDYFAMIDGLSDTQVEIGIEYLICTNPELVVRRDSLKVADIDADWYIEARRLLKDMCKKKNFIGASPVLAINHMDFPMIKKNNERHYKLARAAILRAAQNNDIRPLRSEILDELRKRDV